LQQTTALVETQIHLRLITDEVGERDLQGSELLLPLKLSHKRQCFAIAPNH
jgi:hypothetical protein